MKIRLVAAKLSHVNKQKDRETDMTKLIVAFSEFCERAWKCVQLKDTRITTLEYH
jgi:hypothetical protein